MSEVPAGAGATSYLRRILMRDAIDAGLQSPLRLFESDIEGVCRRWAGSALLEVHPTGAFEKGTANRSGVAIDFLVSLAPDSSYFMRDTHAQLYAAFEREGLAPRRRGAAIGVTLRGIAIDVIPGRRLALDSDEHALFLSRTGHTVVTNPSQHVHDGVACGRRDEIRLIKLWRDQMRLDFPTFNLELAVAAALRRREHGDLAENVWEVLGYLETLFPARSLLDPANANNIVSDQMTAAQREAVQKAARYARAGRAWAEIIR